MFAREGKLLAMALDSRHLRTIGEGWTPVVERDWEGGPVLFKLESQMPTGSFGRPSVSLVWSGPRLVSGPVGRVTQNFVGRMSASAPPSMTNWAPCTNPACGLSR